MLTDYLSHAPVKSEERKEAEEMSIFFCTRGVMAPLNEAMAFHLRSNNPTRIFELWDMYDRWGKKPIYLAGKRNMSIDDRMLYVCAAAAITNEFTWIYHAMSTSSTVFPDWRVNDFVQRALTGYEPAVRQRFRDFLHDAMLTRDVDLFYPLASQVREAGEHGDYEAIEALCRNIRDGIERGLLVPGPALDPKVPKSTWSPRIVDERVWTLLVYGAIRSRKVDVAGMIVQEMKAVGVRPSIRIWNYILMGMVKTGAQPRMLQVLNKMREDGHEPDLMSQTIVLRALFDKRSLAQARGVFLSITGSIPSDRPWTDEETTGLRSAYNVVLNGLLRCQLIEEADKVFATMGKEGPAPDVVTFNTLLNRYAHMKLPQKVKETLHIMGDRNVSPDIYTFTILFVNACHLGDDAMKHILMERMRELDIKANTALLSAAIYSILANGENDSLKHAMQLLRLMEKSPDKEARPNEITYNTILHKIRQQIEDKTIPFAAGHEQMEKIYDGMKRRMFRPNRVTLHVMMKQYLTHPHPDSLRTATAIFNELYTERVDNDDTWYIFLQGLNRRGQLELVAETIRKLQQRQSIQPKKSLLALVERLSWRI
ncbi:hypothetical protein FS842_003161 [Serendipita sp. 407]|nr:hypothetical protein FS842_003161 [Serendipita sp. 407]